MKGTFAKISQRAFRQLLFIALAVTGVTAVLFYKILQDGYLYGRILIHKIVDNCNCLPMKTLMTMHPWIFYTSIALGLIAVSFIFFATYILAKLAWQTRKYSARHLALSKTAHTSRLAQVISDLSLEASRIIETGSPVATVFCYGIWRPKICISEGLLEILSQDELEAVLLHENQHMMVREPAKIFIIKCFQHIFFFLPGLKETIKKYLAYSELAADESATANFTDKSKLARALLKISEAEERTVLRRGLALSFFSSIFAERIKKLSDNAYIPNFKIWGKGFAISLSAVALICLIAFIFVADSTKAFDMHIDGFCGASDAIAPSTGASCSLDPLQPTCSLHGADHVDMSGCRVF